MGALFTGLKTILESQKHILDQMLDAAREHNRALRRLDMPAIMRAVRKGEDLGVMLRRLDQDREGVAAGLSAEFGLPEAVALGVYIDRAPLNIKAEIEELSGRMGRAAAELAEINETNRLLAQQAMRVNEAILRSFDSTRCRIYMPDGRSREEGLPASLINKRI